jgi:hypothetical protein
LCDFLSLFQSNSGFTGYVLALFSWQPWALACWQPDLTYLEISTAYMLAPLCWIALALFCAIFIWAVRRPADRFRFHAARTLFVIVYTLDFMLLPGYFMYLVFS